MMSGIMVLLHIKNIAEYNGVHYTTVSGAIKRIEGKIKSSIARLDLIKILLVYKYFVVLQ